MNIYYADSDGAVWGVTADGKAHCVYDPADPANERIGVQVPAEDVTNAYGPLTPLPYWPPVLPTD